MTSTPRRWCIRMLFMARPPARRCQILLARHIFLRVLLHQLAELVQTLESNQNCRATLLFEAHTPCVRDFIRLVAAPFGWGYILNCSVLVTGSCTTVDAQVSGSCTAVDVPPGDGGSLRTKLPASLPSYGSRKPCCCSVPCSPRASEYLPRGRAG
jgi:hypothetical protein